MRAYGKFENFTHLHHIIWGKRVCKSTKLPLAPHASKHDTTDLPGTQLYEQRHHPRDLQEKHDHRTSSET